MIWRADRSTLLLAAAALLTAGIAVASPQDPASRPLVPNGPSPRPAAPDAPTDGMAHVVLRCTVMVDATVDKCRVAHESAPGNGLGDAAIRMSHQIRIRPENFSKDIVGEEVDIPLSFSREEEVADMPGGEQPPM